MVSTIEFTAKNVKEFSLWLKRFSSIDNSLLLEIDEISKYFLAKVYNEERSKVKFSKIRFDEAGLKVNPSKDPKKVKVGIFNISRLIKIMDQFDDNEFSLVVNYDKIVGDTTEFAGLNLLLKNKNLKINVECTSLNIFKYISEKLFTDVIAKVDKVVAKFDLSKDNIEKTNSLCALDTDDKFLEVSKTKGNIYISGKTFELLILDLNEEWDGKSKDKLDIFKEQFECVDVENYNVEMGEDRLVLKSEDSETITVLSVVEKDE